MNTIPNARVKSCLAGLLCTALLVCIDQLAKYLAVAHLKNKPPIVLIPGVFELRYLENRGAAFGILQGKTILLILVTLVILAAMLFVYVRTPLERKYRPLRGILIFVVASAFGNLADRILQDYVVDFLYFSLIDFPIFNIADCYVVVSGLVFLGLCFFYYKEEDFSFLGRGKT